MSEELLMRIQDMATRIKELERDVNAIQHAMKDAGWHPGRTDDKLTDIIKDRGAEMARLERENAALEKRLQEIQRMCLGYQEEHAELCKTLGRLTEMMEATKVVWIAHGQTSTATVKRLSDQEQT